MEKRNFDFWPPPVVSNVTLTSLNVVEDNNIIIYKKIIYIIYVSTCSARTYADFSHYWERCERDVMHCRGGSKREKYLLSHIFCLTACISATCRDFLKNEKDASHISLSCRKFNFNYQFNVNLLLREKLAWNLLLFFLWILLFGRN